MFNLPFFPKQASTVAAEVDGLLLVWMLVSVVSSLIIVAMVLYFVGRYRRRAEDEIGHQEHESTALEITWSLIPLLVCLGMFAWGTKVFFTIQRPPQDAIEYWVTGKQWMWKIQHPSGVREINTLHMPVGVPVKLTMTSEDVIHDFFVPAFRVKQDVLPGRYTNVWFEATQPGTYHLFCAEYCGAEHSRMVGSIVVMEAKDYEIWLAGGIQSRPAAELGKELFTTLACNTCHVAGGTGRGPDLTNVFGSEVLLTSGRRVKVDETFLRESILNPAAQLTAGYDPLMPTFQGQVNEEQIGYLIAYIKSLRTETTPAEGATK